MEYVRVGEVYEVITDKYKYNPYARRGILLVVERVDEHQVVCSIGNVNGIVDICFNDPIDFLMNCRRVI